MASTLTTRRMDALWHRFGMGLSVLCLVHCLLLPWILVSLPVVALAALPEALRDSEWLHIALIVPVLVVSGPALLRGNSAPWQSGGVLAALAALVGAPFTGSEAAERILTVSGAAMLMVAHALRLRRLHWH